MSFGSKTFNINWLMKINGFETSSVLYFKDYQNSLKPSHVDGEDEWEISIFWEQSDFSKKILTQTRQTFKVHIFWEGHKFLRNFHRRFDPYYIGQIYGGDFAKICGLLRIYELYKKY